jgi:uncharacterized NAD(P)/FAD-binding protein YdhS
MSERMIAVIGLGPRGLMVLERLLRLAELPANRGRRFTVHVVDPHCRGAGLHDPDQPDYLLLNTVCGQLTMFPDATDVPPGTERPGPSLFEWASDRGWRSPGTEDVLAPHDFLPRKALGAYLGWFLDLITRSCPPNIAVVMHCTTAAGLIPDGEGWRVELADGRVVPADAVVLTTGHTEPVRPGKQRLIASPYPLPGTVQVVRPGETLAVVGMGLAAIDLVAACTVGRGGRFDTFEGRLRYRPSGAEPRLLLLSNSGVPYRSRPRFTLPAPEHSPVVFTRDGIDALRRDRGPRLEFDRDVLPLLHVEMRIAYHRCADPEGFDGELAAVNQSAGDLAELQSLLDKRDASHGDSAAAVAEIDSFPRRFADARDYRQRLTDRLADDVAESLRGLRQSPSKVAWELFRSLRDTIRYAVEFDSLTDASAERFASYWTAVMNRTTIGPQVERTQELLALIEAEIVDAPFGPAPTRWFDPDARCWQIRSTMLDETHTERADWLCHAHGSRTDIANPASPLLHGLLGAGVIRFFRPHLGSLRGLDVTRDLRPVRSDGVPAANLYALGPLCEGATFYNHYVPSPSSCSRAFRDAQSCASSMLG